MLRHGNKVVCIVGAKEEDLVGNFVKAHGHFEFMLRRGNNVNISIEKKADTNQNRSDEIMTLSALCPLSAFCLQKNKL
jgi:hypothetical protein